MPVEDDNQVELALPGSDPIVPQPDQRDRYWEVVRRSVERVFRGDTGTVAETTAAAGGKQCLSRNRVRQQMTIDETLVAKAGAADCRGYTHRGKDVSSAPWYHKFNGECRNDHHTTLAQKREAGGLPGGGA